MPDFTPGPWIILGGQLYGHLEPTEHSPWYRKLIFQSPSSPRQLKQWGGLGATEAEYAANVRLGRAAPEMYDLLTTIVNVWDQHQIIGPTVYQDVRALLAKIEGVI